MPQSPNEKGEATTKRPGAPEPLVGFVLLFFVPATLLLLAWRVWQEWAGWR